MAKNSDVRIVVLDFLTESQGGKHAFLGSQYQNSFRFGNLSFKLLYDESAAIYDSFIVAMD